MSVIGAAVTVTESALGVKTAGLGDRYTDKDGKEYVYVQADGAVTGAGYVCGIDENYQAAQLVTTNAAIGDLVGVAGVAFADNDYGWLQVKGPCVARVAASCAANVQLSVTATAGQLDDDGTAGFLTVSGVVLTTARGGSAGTAAAMLNYPTVGADLKALKQGTPTAKTTDATLTAAELLAGIVTVNQGAAGGSAQTLPLAADMDTAFPNFGAGDAFDFSVINISTVGAEDATMTTNTGWTLVGSMVVESNDSARAASSGRFRARKTGTAAWTLYRTA